MELVYLNDLFTSLVLAISDTYTIPMEKIIPRNTDQFRTTIFHMAFGSVNIVINQLTNLQNR